MPLSRCLSLGRAVKVWTVTELSPTGAFCTLGTWSGNFELASPGFLEEERGREICWGRRVESAPCHNGNSTGLSVSTLPLPGLRVLPG